ncbi:MAG: inorganic diphosphatase [Christensenellaceae bacterium]|jgi:inorganic pyrophosphatase|nr:inorganic diphosphatase [Christensenellaceae bacterium]
MNILHDINDSRITPEEFVALIERPTGTRVKYELDKETGLLMLDRIDGSGMFVPMNYGFIPRTLCEDGDALDVFVVTSEILYPMSLVKCKPVGLIRMVDGGERDEKIVAVPVDDPNNDVPKNTVNEIYTYLQYYKSYKKNYKVELTPYENKDAAIKIIKESKEMYKKQGGRKK